MDRLIQPDGQLELRGEWEAEADRWIAWARRPGHDSYWTHHRRQLLRELPPPGRLTVDLGCGEGRVSRDLRTLGHTVIGLDASRALAAATASHEKPTPVMIGDCARLPMRGGIADLAVSFMALQDVDDPGAALAETFRVLEPGGRLHLAVVHPISSGGRFDVDERPATFTFDGRYYDVRGNIDAVSRDGLSMRFASRHLPLERYGQLLESAGFLIETVREPTTADPGSRWYDLPLFLHLVAVKPPVFARLDRRLFHIAAAADAARLLGEGTLTPPSLAAEGFVHCSTAVQVVASTERHLAGVTDLVLVELDPDLLHDEVRWPEVYPGQRFPHLHGPLRASAVRMVHPWSADDQARWSAGIESAGNGSGSVGSGRDD